MNSLVLVINAGSTTVKTRLFDAKLHVQAVLNADYGLASGLVIEGYDVNSKVISETITSSHDAKSALAVVLNRWREIFTTGNLAPAAIGHRIVHGASWFDALTPITPEVLDRLAQLDSYAPLHNPLNRLGVAMAAKAFPEVAQFAAFDTAFHRHIPDYAGRYAIPQGLSQQVDFYRYGFHGISCQHSLWAAAALLDTAPERLNLIVLHLGGGASITAIREGVGIDTSMGFSPTEGLIMAGRCGDLDPIIPLTLQREGWTLEQLDHLLNHDSGLRGICGHADMRTVLQKAEQGDADAMLAIDMFCYRIKKYIGAYYAVLGDISALIFTGGVGEHAPAIRTKIIAGLDKLGFLMDEQLNQQPVRQNRDIGSDASDARILVIHAEEERVCARQILNFLGDGAQL